jgi:hypothetical protein
MTEKGTLVDKFYGIADSYYSGSDDFVEIEKVLAHYEKIMNAVNEDSLAGDGMEMIESAMRREMKD